MRGPTADHKYHKVPAESTSTLPSEYTPPKAHPRWRLVIFLVILAIWLCSMAFFLPPLLLPERIHREGNNLVYWTPQRTGSASVRAWLWAVAAVLRIDMAASFSFMNNTDEDDHRTRHNRLGVPRCSFLTGHINTRSVDVRDNELKLGAVITTIRDPAALLTSRYFYRSGNRLSKKFLDGYSNPLSRSARLWFFYWNDRDPCEQLRYYDGLPGCGMRSISGLQRRARAIAERIDCVIDTDDPKKDLSGLCRHMTLDDEECPRFRRGKSGRVQRAELYEKFLNFTHIRQAMSRHLTVATMLRDELAKRKCRLLDDDSEKGLRTPRADAAQWPTKMCSNVTSTLDDDRDDDSPENNAVDDDDMFAGEGEEGVSDTEDNETVGGRDDDVDGQ